MPTTLTTLRDQIILDANIKGHPNFPSLRLNRIINLAQRYVQIQLNGLGYKKFEVIQDISAGLAAGAFASGTNNVKKCPIDATYFVNMLESPKSILFIRTDDSSTYGIAYEVDPLDFKEQLGNSFLAPTLAKPVFMRLAQYIWLAPTTITNAHAHYYKNISDLTDTTGTISNAVHSSGVITVTATAHGLVTGDDITIASVVGMTDLNGNHVVESVTSANAFTVRKSTEQSYSSAGTITKNTSIPAEFEEYIVKKSVIEIQSALGQDQNKEGQLAMLNKQIASDYEKFFGKIQNLNINKQLDKVKLQ